MLVHNARHIIVPLINHENHKCSICNRHFPSVKTLFQHRETQHGVKVKIQHIESKHNVLCIEEQNENKHHKPNENNKPDLRNSESQNPCQNNSVKKPEQYKMSQIPNQKNYNNEKQNDQNLINIKNEDIIDISDSSNDSKSKSTLSKDDKTDIFNSMLTKQPLVTCDLIVNELIKRSQAKTSIEKQPVIIVEDTISRLLYKETYAKEKTFVEHDNSLAEIIKIDVVQGNKDSVQIMHESEFENYNDYEVATIKKVEEKFDNVAKIKPFHMDSYTEIIGNKHVEIATIKKVEDKFENVAKIKPFHMTELDTEMRKENIRNKLVFEDDEEDDEDDLITYDNFECNLKHAPGEGVKETKLYQGKMLFGTRVTETYTPSVHYDDLIEEQTYICRRCGLISSNR